MKKCISFLLALVLIGTPIAPVLANSEPELLRIAGSNRYETAVEISKYCFTSADAVVIASGEGFADALTGGTLASAVKGPILLTEKKTLPASTEAEIKRLAPKQIYLLGGENSVSTEVEFALFQYAPVERIAGFSRFDTAALIREKALSLDATLFKDLSTVVNGYQFSDALPAAAYAVYKKRPLILTNGTDEVLATDTLIGGMTSAPHYSGSRRLSGANRYASSVAIAKSGFPKATTLILASGSSYPDALAAVSLSQKYSAPILLTDQKVVPKEIAAYVDNYPQLKRIIIVGGESTVSKEVGYHFVPERFPEAPTDFTELNKKSNARHGWAYQHNDPDLEALIQKYDAYSRIPGTPKQLALTFDCGYSLKDYTSRILDTLAEKDVDATFFLAGSFIDAEPKTTKRMTNEGNVVGNHTVDHLLAPDIISSRGIQRVIDDVKGLEEKYEQVTGLKLSPVLRAPEGLWSERSLALYQMMGYQTFFWDLAYLDWDPNNQYSPERALALLKEKTRPGAVILLHTISHTNTVILGDYIDWARSQGYEFVTALEVAPK